MSIKIKSIQANRIYGVSIGQIDNYWFDEDTTISTSLFEKYLRTSGAAITSNDTTKDLINVKFDYPFKLSKNKDSDTTIDIDSVSTIDLRTIFYTKGFDITYSGDKKIHYVPLYRSTGKAKDGVEIFVRDSLANNTRNFLSMGLWDRMPKQGAKIVELSAYMSLPTATAKGFIKIPLNNILIVKDEDMFFDKEVVTVSVDSKEVETEAVDFKATEEIIHRYGLTFSKRFKKKNPGYELIERKKEELISRGISDYVRATATKKYCVVSEPSIQTIKSVLADGEGIIDESIFPDKYTDSKGNTHDYNGFVYCRNHFFKACLFRGNIQLFFKDYYKDKYEAATIRDMFGNDILVKDIKVVTTSNAIKWLKLKELMGATDEEQYRYFDSWLKKYDYEFEIVKTAQKSKYGAYQRSSYQMNNSLPTKDLKVLQGVAQTSIDYCNELKTNHEAFIRHLRATAEDYNINNLLIDLDDKIPRFRESEFFRKEKNKIINKFKTYTLMRGKLLQVGDNLTLCSNPYELLLHSVKADYRANNTFKSHSDYIECSTTRFDYDRFLAGFRSPHNAPNNTLYLKNIHIDTIDRYFPNLGNNVIVVNSIDTDIQPRASGCDFDSDFIFTTDQENIVELAAESYKHFPTIINGVDDKPSSYDMTMKAFADMDNTIASGQSLIGGSSDLAQLVLSYYLDELEIENGYRNKEYEDIFIICSVLAQLGIDGAKKNFDIKGTAELLRLRNSECLQDKPYPMFFAEIKNDKKIKRNKKEPWKSDFNKLIDITDESQVKELQCPMDILRKCIDEGIVDKRTHNKSYPNIFYVPKQKIRDIRRDQVSKVIKDIEDYNNIINGFDKSKEDYSDKVKAEFEKVLFKIKKLGIKYNTMCHLINYALSGNCAYKNRLLALLYSKDKTMFLSCFEPKIS